VIENALWNAFIMASQCATARSVRAVTAHLPAQRLWSQATRAACTMISRSS
jgi:hypothetical protein